MTSLFWDAECEQELAEIEAELERSRHVEPVSPEAAARLRETIDRAERIVARLRARAKAAA